MNASVMNARHTRAPPDAQRVVHGLRREGEKRADEGPHDGVCGQRGGGVEPVGVDEVGLDAHLQQHCYQGLAQGGISRVDRLG